MKKKLCYLCLIMLVTAAAGAAFSYAFGSLGREGRGAGKEERLLVVTSFYPIYVIAQNLTEGIEGVEVRNLAANQTGCLHDYQLTTKDMKLLEEADLFLMNGGGMESFFAEVADNLPGLPVVLSAAGMELLPEESGHSHEEEASEEEESEEKESEEEHFRGAYNAHIWLNPERYERQVENLAAGLAEYDPEHREQYEKNASLYREKIRQLEEEYETAFAEVPEQEVVIFHEAFAYLGEWLPLEIAHTVAVEGENNALSAGELAEVIEEIRYHGIHLLLAETQYGEAVATGIAAETGAEVLVLDSLVSGSEERDSWLTGMRANLVLLTGKTGR